LTNIIKIELIKLKLKKIKNNILSEKFKKQITIFKIKYTTKIGFPTNNYENCFSF